MSLPGPWVRVGRDVLRGVPWTYMLAVVSMKLGHNSLAVRRFSTFCDAVEI